jgi:hypothetical protein
MSATAAMMAVDLENPMGNEQTTSSCLVSSTQDELFRQRKDYNLLRQVVSFGRVQSSVFIPISEIISPISASIATGKKKLLSRAYLSPRENNENISQKTENILPFCLYSSSVASNCVANLHQDFYGDSSIPTLQGPFSEENVGGVQYRHVPVGVTGSRPEGFKIYVNASGYYVQGPDTEALKVTNAHLPRGTFYRDGTSKSPVVFKNISGKNYNKKYEYLQTVGRTGINKDLIMSGGVGFPSASAMPMFFLGLTSSVYPLVHRTDYPAVQHVRHQNVFTERFSAPGGPETLGAFGLDPLAGEYSPWNGVNVRNYTVRKYNNANLNQHCGQYGLSGSASALTYELSASIYKTHRNSTFRPVYTYSNTDQYKNISMRRMHDTELVVSLIPRNDSAYAWITGSYNSSSFGYITGSELQFASVSARGVNLQGWGSSSLTEFNDIMCNRNGVGGFSSWKMIRVGQRRDARFMRENNIFTYLLPSRAITVVISGSL